MSYLIFSTTGFSQSLIKENLNNPKNQEECKSDILLQELMANDPSYAQTIANYKNLAKQVGSQNKATLYKIPIVVHVIHLGEPEGTGTNISDAQIHSAINNLNQAYRNQAPYTGVDIEVEFCLAAVDPSGNPTSGITRNDGSGTSDYATQGITNDGGSSLNEVAIKALSNWGNTDYYQFWIVAGIDGNMGGGGTQGYAYFSQAASKDGAVILYNSFGYDPTGTLCYNLKSYTNQNVTTTHEVGHAFGLYHTFEGDGTGSTCPTNTDCNNDGDEVCDTPPHKRSASDCVVATNTCTGGSSSEHIHNFMDYSSDVCQTEFTANQKTKARAWLLAVRLSLTTSTKCNPVAVPVSNFEAVCGSQSGCAGSSINFFDLSEGNPTAWSWSFTGGTPSTSTSQYPTVSYAAAGTYAVTLTATNSFGTGNVETKNGFITIYSTPTSACSPGSQNAGNFWQTLYNVTFNDINNSTSQYVNTAYSNFSCSQTTQVTAGQSYNMSISINAEGGSGNEVFESYIDYNNNGSFADAGELVFSGSVTSGSLGTFNQNIAIPLTATTNTLLRMRVIGETTSISSNERNCLANYFVGDVEDYGVYITPASLPPVANFSGTPTTLCTGSSVSFTDLSTNTPTSWSWSFTGGTPLTSTAQNPTITYNTPGTYQVVLTATNSAGSDGETKVGYITVNPINTASAASSSPTLCINTLMTNITHTTTGATGIGAPSGLPSGVNAGWASNTITISGTPSASGTFNYTIPLTGGCGTVNATGTITVTPNKTASAASSSPTLCINTLMTNITHTTTGATGIGAPSGLPSGVNAGWASNTITISGTPSASGTFNYTIPLTGGCGTVNATGTITVNPLPGNAGAITGSTSECDNATSVAYSISSVANATGYNWTVPSGATVASGQNTTSITVDFGVTSGNVSVTPNNSCGDGGVNNKAVTIAPCGSAPVADFSTNTTTICAGESVNFSDLSTNSPTSWSWNFGDGGSSISQNTTYTYNTPGTYTVTLTATNASGSDDEVKTNLITVNVLDDASFNYSVSTYCQDGVDPTPTISGTTGGIFTYSPAGLAINSSTGIIDLSVSIVGTYTVTYTTGGVCSDAQNTQVTIVNCGSTELKPIYRKTYSSYSEKLACYIVTGAQDYEWEFVPVGGGTTLNYVRGSNNPSILLGWITSIQDGITYNVRIRANVGGVFGSFGNAWSITTPGAQSSTSINTLYCGKTYSSYSEQLSCYTVTNATEYEFEFNPILGGSIINYIHTGNSILLNWTTGLIDNTSYNVRVRAKVSGVFGSYGFSCQITTPSSSVITSLKSIYCGVTYTSMSNKIACYTVTGAEDYEFEFIPVGGGTPLLDTNISTSPSILLNMMPGIQVSTTYDVRVRAKLSGVYGSFGSSCQVTTPSSAMVLNETARLMSDNENETKDGLITASTTLSIYPNPNTGEQLSVNLENLTPNSTLTITDIYGKVILTKPLNTDQSEFKVNVKFENKLASGFYLVTIISDGNRITEKLIVR